MRHWELWAPLPDHLQVRDPNVRKMLGQPRLLQENKAVETRFDSKSGSEGDGKFEMVADDESDDDFEAVDDDDDDDDEQEPEGLVNKFGDPMPTPEELAAMESEGRGLLELERSDGPPTPVELPSPRSDYPSEDSEWRYYTNMHLTPRRNEHPPELPEDTPVKDRKPQRCCAICSRNLGDADLFEEGHICS